MNLIPAPTGFYEMAGRFARAASAGRTERCEPVGVLVARLMCTDIAYRYGTTVEGCREGELDEIHLGLARALNLPEGYAAKFTDIELDYEAENLEPNPAIEPLLRVASQAGLEVVMISDMYMGARHIHRLLEVHFPGRFDEAQIYSSGDLKISKRSGRLFDHVAAISKVAPDQALHVGDNLDSDYRCARERGWQAVYLPHSDKEQTAIDRDEKAVMNELLASGIDIRRLPT